MTEPEPKPPEQRPDDSPSSGDFVALGIGCLVTLLLIGAALYYGLKSG
jgi:hypothetical protein